MDQLDNYNYNGNSNRVVESCSKGRGRDSGKNGKKSPPVPIKGLHDENQNKNRPLSASTSPKRKGKTKQQQQMHSQNDSKKMYPRVETFRSEEKQSLLLKRVLYSLGLYDSPEGMRRRHETLHGLEDLLNQWNESFASKDKSPARVALLSFGSSRLQVHKPGADMDLLALCPSHCTRKHFFTTLVQLLKHDHRIEDVHPIPAAYTPVVKLTMNGISVDLLFAGLKDDTKLQHHARGSNYNIDDSDLQGLDVEGVRSLNGARVAQILAQSVPNQESYRTTLRAVKEWANVHGLYSNVLGCLGGINYALLVACICRRHKNAQPPTLLKAFFHTFANWNWPTPVTLTHVAHDPPPGVAPLPVWDAKTNPRDRMHIMPILTPTYPSMNSAYNVGIPQLRRLTLALQSGLQVIQDIEAGKKLWADLFQNNFFQRHAIFLQTNIMASNGADFMEWFRFVESRLRLLIAGLDNPHYGVQAEPFCKFYDRMYDSRACCVGPGKSQQQNKTESCLFIGLRFDVDNADLSCLVGEFLHKINTWKGRVAGMDLTMEIVGQESLPKFLLHEPSANPNVVVDIAVSNGNESPQGERPPHNLARSIVSTDGRIVVEMEPKESDDLQHPVVTACSGQSGSSFPSNVGGFVPQASGGGPSCDSSDHERDILQQQEEKEEEVALPETRTTTESDVPPVVSWAMKVSGSYTKQQQQNGKLNAIASPAKRART